LKTTHRLTLILFSLLPVAMAGQMSAPDSNLTTNPVFQKSCAKCHGKTAEGRHFGGPSLTSEKISKLTEGELENIISNGKGRMPKFGGKLNSEEIRSLVHQISQAAGIRK
jgi:mono/diheme cytochrome c family protein